MPLYKRIDQHFLRYFESLICVSPDLVEECERLRIPKQRLHHVPNAIDVEYFRRRLDSVSAKEAIQARPDRFLIGSVGRLSQEKGFDRLIQAVVLLQQQGLPLDLWIAGDGPEREELTRIIGQHTTDGSIRLLGQMADLRMFYQAMDLFVLNSTREGLPNVLLEAQALETPSIATRVGGVPDLINPGRTGYLIEPQDDLELVQSIQRAISSPELGAEMAAAGRKNIVERFGFDARMKKIATIYRDMLEKSTRWTSKSK
jgi:glycosyltransferase involved in cell wall biosynthesis